MGFSIPRWMLDYVSPPCEMINVYYAEFFRGLIVISMFAITNSFTFCRMHMHNRKKESSTMFETSQQKKRRAVETAFVQQVTFQGLLYVIELVTYFYISNSFPVPLDPASLYKSPNRWPNFLLTTYAWILVHTLDGRSRFITHRDDSNRKKSSILACTFISNSNTGGFGSSVNV
uniref:7TM_GPCR_Srx domain-containing protein n=1 Tax=Caenorhabditis japonica TaxID=281687 RepID=A0A8R1HKZ2_CAEJA